MSAPTRLLIQSKTQMGGQTGVHSALPAIVAASPADVRLWLLDQGAQERQWCETHDRSEFIDGLCSGFERYTDDVCRMVSVLVYKP